MQNEFAVCCEVIGRSRYISFHTIICHTQLHCYLLNSVYDSFMLNVVFFVRVDDELLLAVQL